MVAGCREVISNVFLRSEIDAKFDSWVLTCVVTSVPCFFNMNPQNDYVILMSSGIHGGNRVTFCFCSLTSNATHRALDSEGHKHRSS